MLARLRTLVFALPLVSALTLIIPDNPTSESSLTVDWTASTTDPTSFSLELVHEAFHSTYALVSDVPTADGSVTFTLPSVPASSGYSLEAVATNNLTMIYDQTAQFSIGAVTTNSTTTDSGSTTSTSAATDTSASPTLLASLSTTAVSSATHSSSGTSTLASTTPSTLSSSGAGSFKVTGIIPAAALVLAVASGAALVF